MTKTPTEKSVLIACIGAVSAIVAAVAAPICSTFLADAVPAEVAVVTPAREVDSSPVTPGGPPIEGTWKQWVYDETNTAVEVGTFVVSRQQGEYLVSARAQAEGERMMNSIGIFGVEYDGALWTFNSNWGAGEVGNFHLERVSDTVFEGEIRVAGKVPNRTRWVRIQ